MNLKAAQIAMLLGLGATMTDHSDIYMADGLLHHKRGSSHKDYTNKNANIEYYTDEKGNIRKRKIKK